MKNEPVWHIAVRHKNSIYFYIHTNVIISNFGRLINVCMLTYFTLVTHNFSVV